jgi:small subunit ribosomal protein S3
VIIGRSGSGIEELKKQLKKKFFGSKKMHLSIEVEEVRNPDLDAELVVQSIAYQLEKRVPFRRAMKRAIEQVMAAGAKGVKIICSGRLNGVEIARTETLSQGSVPTHTLRADIDYSRGAAYTLYGAIGIKVWIYRGQVFADTKRQAVAPVRPASRERGPSRTKRQAGQARRTIVKKHTNEAAAAK